MQINIVITGVGGQGTLLASRILGALAADNSMDVKVSEVHGMAQRGGNVVTYVRIGDRVHSPLVEYGQADVVLAFEQLEALRALPYEQAHKRLLQLKGVGPKVADCVLLFGCRHSLAFPVDVWMERAMQNYMPGCTNRAELKRCAQRQWGDDAGILQQYLFHAARMGIITTGEAQV